MKKRILAVLVAAAAALTLAGCDNGGGKGGKIKVGIINNDPNESGYRTANVNDMQRVFCEENGFEASFAYSLKNEEQITAAQKMIQDDVDYLLISAAASAGWDSVLNDAKKAGIKVILFDRKLDADESLYEAAVISDMAKEGETAVAWLKNQNFPEYNIIHIQGTVGSDAQIGRSKALDEEAKASGWNIVTQQTGEWSAEKAQQIVQSVIDGGTKFNVVYCENDNMAQGAVAALDKAGISHGVGKDVCVMGFDCNLFGMTAVLNGEWNYEGQCNPFQADIVKDLIDKLEKGESISPKTFIMDEKGFGADTITQDDVDKYSIK